MSVAARVIDDAGVVAGFALIEMFAQCRCPTQRQFRQCALYMRHSLTTILSHEVSRILTQDIDYLELLSGRFARGVVGSTQPGTCRIGSQSMGLGVDRR